MKKPSLMHAMTPFPYSVDLNASYDEASRLMAQHNVRHLPVTDNHQVVGVLTDRDLTSAMQVHTRAGGSDALNVRDLYVPDPYVVSVDEPIDNVLTTMAERHIGSAIVTKAGKLVGMFTTVDVCRSFSAHLREQFPPSDGDEVA